jgi:hypothetical protein
MSVEGKAKILRIFLNEKTKLGNELVYEAMVQAAFKKGIEMGPWCFAESKDSDSVATNAVPFMKA